MNDYRLIMTGAVLVVALAPLTRVWPALDIALVVLIVGAVAVGVAGYWLREAVREYRFRCDMRALDVRDAARAARAEVPA